MEAPKILEDYRTLTGDSPYKRWLLTEIQNSIGHRILEVGTGIGGWIGCLSTRELVVSIDISPERIEIARQNYRSENVVFALLDICNDEALRLSDYCIDTILCINTLEHIEDDRKALSNMHSLLQPDGHLLLIAPSCRWLYGTLDKRYGHYRRYNKTELYSMLSQTGFILERFASLNLLGALGWFIYGRLLKLDGTPTRSFELFNRLVPVCAAIDRMLGPPFGLSIVAIARK